ncbi:MAG TPA: 16S rRNA (uracil(1498)-N(3))-methyltransferase [Leptolyngbyaceae cyanobacterium]
MSPQRVLIASEQYQAQQIVLTAAQQRYLHRVLRLGQGEQFIALDGQGRQWLAELTADPSIAMVLEALADTQKDLPTAQITLLAALPKGNGFDEVVRQTTELGVTCIQPIISDRTLIRPSDQKLERWQRIAAEATEQSERLKTPEICSPLLWRDLLAKVPQAPCYLCVTRWDSPHLLTCLQIAPPQAIAIAIGPEGGWTDAEVEDAIASGFQPVSLGSTILRAVTAPVVALSLIKGVMDAQATPLNPQSDLLGETANNTSQD